MKRSEDGRGGPPESAEYRYARYAAAFLALTVLSGVWLRTTLLRPETLAGFSFRNLVHAHSHLAFFGWVTMALFALVLRASGREEAGWPRWHADLLAAASAAAFVGFLWSGYAPLTIALSAVHVGLWVEFVRRIWPAGGSPSPPADGTRQRHRRDDPLPRATPRPANALLRVALVFLVLAGAGTIGTGILSARAVDPWTSRLAIELFLTPFVAGWLVLGAFGAAYGRLSRPRFARLVLVAGAVGALPSGLLHITAPPPAAWVLPVGRLGMLLVATASIAFALDVLRERTSPFLQLAGAAALLKGAVELTVGLGFASHLLGSHHLAIGYLHLVLLGLVTSILMDALLAPARVVAPATVHGVGLAVQLGALAVLGWPSLLHLASSWGLSVDHLLALALGGGGLSALGLMAASAHVITGRAPGASSVTSNSEDRTPAQLLPL